MKNPAPARPGRGCDLMATLTERRYKDYFWRRNRSRVAPPGATKATDVGLGTALNHKNQAAFISCSARSASQAAMRL
jgi:hypothetical protein